MFSCTRLPRYIGEVMPLSRRRTERESEGDTNARKAALHQVSIPVLPELPECCRDRSICDALFQRRFEDAAVLMEEGKGVRYLDSNGRNLLHLAITVKAPAQIISKLLDQDVDPSVQDIMYKRTPLHYLIICGSDASVVEALLSHPRTKIAAEMQDKFGNPPLLALRRSVQVPIEQVRSFVKCGYTQGLQNLYQTAVYSLDGFRVIELLRLGARPTHLGVALNEGSPLGDEKAYAIIQVRFMLALCQLSIERLVRGRLPRLPSELLHAVMVALFPTTTPSFSNDQWFWSYHGPPPLIDQWNPAIVAIEEY